MNFPRLDKSVLVVSSFEEEEKVERDFWHSQTPHKRLEALETLRRINHGEHATARLQRLLEVTERE